ncbi:elongation factor P 5-aminopentanone reductase [Mesobacillus maritimus]|uniref:SDR family oxidoreductase n=1 Tax=Mesobacillus maritimus TaxID=1643336 RepID=A0ABS7KAJ8_9BACI|nr:SDR family oxidoreductase [Mesobacillus maritimus]MBY0099272.1 SDR family oxidoreductase [Mesobacillus maritimus]
MKKFILITGASGAIGQAVAFKLAEKGYSLYLHYNQNREGIEKLIHNLEAFEGEYIPIMADLSLPNGYKQLASQIFSLDGIIHNAGQALYGLLQDLTEDDLAKLLHVSVTTPLLLTKALLPKLIMKREGAIIVISSIWGQTGASFEVAYSTVKGAQISFTKALSKELAPSGIRVNAVAPGAVETPMLSGFSPDELSAVKEEIPLSRLATPRDIANGVGFLLSDDSSYITGHVLAINGGWYM